MTTHPLRARADLSNELIHFIRRPTPDEAFEVLQKIVLERRLLGGTGFVRGGHRCVCFTEAPLDAVAEVVWRSTSADLKYQAFGVAVTKSWLFARGGRPVIYGPDSDYELLPTALKYRHVRYEPTSDRPIDLTWEREWRINVDQLDLDPNQCRLVVLEDDHERRLHRAVQDQEDIRIQQLGHAVGPAQAEQYRERFPWDVVVVGTISPDDEAQYYADRGYHDR